MLSGSIIRPAAIVLVTIVFLISKDCSAKIYNRCELAKTLYRTYKFPFSTLGDWVCLIEAHSGRNTRAISAYHPNGSRNFGLFQINSFYWCSGGPMSYYNTCRVSCSALINDDITADVNCAKLIYIRYGFNAWNGWINRCKGKNVKFYLANCIL